MDGRCARVEEIHLHRAATAPLPIRPVLRSTKCICTSPFKAIPLLRLVIIIFSCYTGLNYDYEQIDAVCAVTV